MGVTWILGIAANLKILSFLWYPYVVLNSLQGTPPYICATPYLAILVLLATYQRLKNVHAISVLVRI